jgi:hypothetical protein
MWDHSALGWWIAAAGEGARRVRTEGLMVRGPGGGGGGDALRSLSLRRRCVPGGGVGGAGGGGGGGTRCG